MKHSNGIIIALLAFIVFIAVFVSPPAASQEPEAIPPAQVESLAMVVTCAATGTTHMVTPPSLQAFVQLHNYFTGFTSARGFIEGSAMLGHEDAAKFVVEQCGGGPTI